MSLMFSGIKDEKTAAHVCRMGIALVESFDRTDVPVSRSDNPLCSEKERAQLKEYERVVDFVRKTFSDGSKTALERCEAVAKRTHSLFKPRQGVFLIEHLITRLCFMATTGDTSRADM